MSLCVSSHTAVVATTEFKSWHRYCLFATQITAKTESVTERQIHKAALDMCEKQTC